MPASAPPATRRSLLILLLVVFIDLVGFGLVAPLIPFYAEQLGLAPQWITAAVASYSLMQFVAAPLLGRWSDRIGRKPVLFFSMVGHAAAYVLLALSHNIWMFLAARIVGGITGGNLPVAYAYIADNSHGHARAAAIGKISGAFGLGMVLGPALGGLLAGSDAPLAADLATPAWTAAVASLLSAIAIAIWLPESPGQQSQAGADRAHHATADGRAIEPTVLALLVICFVVIFGMALRESIFALWVSHTLRLGARDIGLLFALAGAVIAVLQFAAIGSLTRRFGSHALALSATGLLALSWIGLAVADRLQIVIAAVILTAAGTALFQTSIQNLLANIASPGKRGSIMGAYQSSSALARFVGQSSSGSFYGLVHVSAPFLIGALLMLPAALLLVRIRTRLLAATEAAQTESPQETPA